MFKRIFLAVLALFLLVTSSVFAATQNGVVVNHFDYSGSAGQDAEHFIDYNPQSTSFVYNMAGGTAITDGSIDLRQFKVARHAQVAVKTLGATSVTVNITGKSWAASTWGLVFEKVYTAAEDEIIVIPEKTDQLRVALKIAGAGTNTVSVIGQYHSKIKY